MLQHISPDSAGRPSGRAFYINCRPRCKRSNPQNPVFYHAMMTQPAISPNSSNAVMNISQGMG
jgi:hypothetical protein